MIDFLNFYLQDSDSICSHDGRLSLTDGGEFLNYDVCTEAYKEELETVEPPTGKAKSSCNGVEDGQEDKSSSTDDEDLQSELHEAEESERTAKLASCATENNNEEEYVGDSSSKLDEFEDLEKMINEAEITIEKKTTTLQPIKAEENYVEESEISEKVVEEFEEAASESISEIVEETKKTQDNVEEISLLQSSEDIVEETTVTQFEVEETLDVTVDMVYSESVVYNEKEKESREKSDQGASEKIIDLEVDRTSTITEEKVTLSDGISVKLEEPVKSSPSKKKWWTPKKDFLTPKKESKTPKKSPKSKTKLSFSYFRSGSPVNSSEDESDFDAQSGLTIVTFCIIINISFNLIIGFCVIHRRILPSRMVSFSTQDLLNRALANRTVIRSIPLTSEICTSIHWVFSSETSGWTVKATKLACSFVVSTSKARHGSTDTCSATISWLKSTVAR